MRNLEAEQTKFNNGLSTNFQVSEIQDALADAQFAEIRARVNYRKSWRPTTRSPAPSSRP